MHSALRKKQTLCSVFLLFNNKHPLKEFTTIAKRRRMRKQQREPNAPYSNKGEAGECFRHAYSIKTHVLLMTETKAQPPFQAHQGLQAASQHQRQQDTPCELSAATGENSRHRRCTGEQPLWRRPGKGSVRDSFTAQETLHHVQSWDTRRTGANKSLSTFQPQTRQPDPPENCPWTQMERLSPFLALWCRPAPI